MRKVALFCGLLLHLSGCSSESADLDEELDQLRAEVEQLQFDSLPVDELDRNGDGQSDLFCREEGQYFYELVDNNFDGSIDESWKYDQDDVLVSGRVDENFDGILETELVYKEFLLHRVFSDTDANGVIDLASEFKTGEVSFSERFYGFPHGNRIGRVEFSYGYPSGPEELRETKLSEEEFQDLWLDRQ